jgi:hypothetical protein
MKHLPDGIHAVHACCIFENMKYEIFKYDRMKEEKDVNKTREKQN